MNIQKHISEIRRMEREQNKMCSDMQSVELYKDHRKSSIVLDNIKQLNKKIREMKSKLGFEI